MSEVSYPTRRSRFGQPTRSSSRAAIPLRRLGTLSEVPSVDVLDESRTDRGETGRRMSGTQSSGESHLPTPHRPFDSSADHDNGSSDNLKNEQQPESLPPVWAAEPRDDASRRPLLKRPHWNPKNI